MWLICCLHLFPQDAEQQQHQQTVCGQFQPHAKAQDLVSGVTEGGTMSPVCARLCYWSIDWLNVTTFTFSSGVSCYTLNNITFNYRLFSLPLCLFFLFLFFSHLLLCSLSRLHSNNLHCDCHVAWLSEWLRQRPRLGLYTQCMAPPHLRGHNVAEVQKKEFVCTGGFEEDWICLDSSLVLCCQSSRKSTCQFKDFGLKIKNIPFFNPVHHS